MRGKKKRVRAVPNNTSSVVINANFSIMDRSIELIPETAEDTERSVVIRDHPFTNELQPWMPCIRCGLAAAAHEKVKDVYISNSPETICTNTNCEYRVASPEVTCPIGHIQHV